MPGIVSTAPARSKATKPAKPYEGFPLGPHGNGQWCKRIKGTLRFFGRWADDLDGAKALTRYNEERSDLEAGHVPRARGSQEITLRELCNEYLATKQKALTGGKIKQRTYEEYKQTTDRIIDQFGKLRTVKSLGPTDFDAFYEVLEQRYGTVSLGNEINRVRMVFGYAESYKLITEPVTFGELFVKPTEDKLREHRRANGRKDFSAADIVAMLGEARPQIRAMILLGINCGFGNADVGLLPIDAVDLEEGWVEFARTKNFLPRMCPLWPETVEAVKLALKFRRKPHDSAHDHLLFITRKGEPWHKDNSKKSTPLSKEFQKLMELSGVYRKGAGFYGLRHTFETQGGNACDQVAIDVIMGHAAAGDNKIPANYRHEIWGERFVKVTNLVRTWLFSAAEPIEDGAIVKFQARA